MTEHPIVQLELPKDRIKSKRSKALKLPYDSQILGNIMQLIKQKSM